MAIEITATYAAVLALMMMGLFYYVTMLRASADVSINDGGNIALAERMRRHGNFVETVPMALIVLALAEAAGMGATYVHAAGLILIASRVVHPFGVRHDKAATFARIASGSGTTIAILIPVASLLFGPFGA